MHGTTTSPHARGMGAALGLSAATAVLAIGAAPVPALAAPGASAAACSKQTATRASRSLVGDAAKRWQFSFTVDRVLCADFSGDGDSDLFVMLEARQATASSPTPWGLYNRRGARYRLKAKRITTIASRPSVKQGRLRLREAVYAKADPNCCPSRTRIVEYRWTGRRYARKVVKTIENESG